MLSPYATIMESMFQVINREGQLVPFKLLPAQLALDAALTGRDIVPKSRQLGISSYVIGRFTARCLAKTNQRCVIISHEEESTKRLFAKAKTILENLRSPRKDIVIEADIGRLTQSMSGMAVNQDFIPSATSIAIMGLTALSIPIGIAARIMR